jgi:hypothetical protein
MTSDGTKPSGDVGCDVYGTRCNYRLSYERATATAETLRAELAQARSRCEELTAQYELERKWHYERADKAHEQQLRAEKAEKERDEAKEKCLQMAEAHERGIVYRDAMAAALREAKKYADELDPRNASERYDAIADAFYRETRLWPPGRSMPMAMGGVSEKDEKRAREEWSPFCNRWHERRADEIRTVIDAALAVAPPPKSAREAPHAYDRAREPWLGTLPEDD